MASTDSVAKIAPVLLLFLVTVQIEFQTLLILLRFAKPLLFIKGLVKKYRGGGQGQSN